jgi:hypothetical protein
MMNDRLDKACQVISGSQQSSNVITSPCIAQFKAIGTSRPENHICLVGSSTPATLPAWADTADAPQSKVHTEHLLCKPCMGIIQHPPAKSAPDASFCIDLAIALAKHGTHMLSTHKTNTSKLALLACSMQPVGLVSFGRLSGRGCVPTWCSWCNTSMGRVMCGDQGDAELLVRLGSLKGTA